MISNINNNSKDYEVTNPPSDSISSMDFSSQADYLAVSSWDNQVRIYEVHSSLNTIARASYAHEAPALCVSWSKDGTKVGSGGADKAVRVFDIASGQTIQVGQHNDTVKCAKFLEQGNILATASWDKTLKYWDLRSPQPVGTVQLPERCYTMDSKGSLLVLGLAERQISVIDLNQPQNIAKSMTSSLKWQTRAVSCFPDAKGFAVGSIEGRIGVHYVEAKDQSKNFSFKCHRDDSKNIFAVNDISFHPIHGTFSTCSSDGTFNFWDKDARQRLKVFPKNIGQVSSSCFNNNGNIFAYAVSYDWSKGYKHADPASQNKIYLHAVKDDEIKPRAGRRR